MDVEQLVADLISIDSTNPDLGEGAGEAEIASFVVEWLASHGVEAWCQDTGHPGRPNAIGRVGSGSGPTLMLNGHLDTVGVGGHVDPFVPRVEGRKMFGRGALDTKSGVAALMVATAKAAQVGIDGTVLFTGVADEEHASLGTSAVIREYSADFAIVTEPSLLDINIAHKGFEWFEIETVGHAAHGSKPELGVDAISKMGRVLTGIEELGARLAEGPAHPLLGTGSIHASLIEGGQEVSSYPSSCVLTLERRTIPGETTETAEAELTDLLAACREADPQFQAELRHGLSRASYEIASDHPLVEMMASHTAAVTGEPVRLSGQTGWMDTALLAAAGIPAAVIGPKGVGLHADVEWVDLDSVHDVVEVVSRVIAEYCI